MLSALGVRDCRSGGGCGLALSCDAANALDRAVRTLIRDCLGSEPGEEVLVICNPVTEELGALLRINAQGEGGEATLAVISERDSHAAEPPAPVAAAMLAADVVIAPTIQSLSHTAARRGRERGGCAGRLDARRHRGDARAGDGRRHEAAAQAGRRVGRVLGAGAEARITSPAGQRSAARPGGTAPRSSTPASSTCAAPSATSPAARRSSRRSRAPAEGTLVVDGSIAGIGKLETPVELTVRGRPPDRGQRRRRRAPAGAAHRARRRRHQRRRARHRHQRRGDPHRQHPRGREDPRHRPRRLRRLGGDRRHRPGPGPPRLRRARADRRGRRRSRSCEPASCSSERCRAAARRPQRLRGARRGADRPPWTRAFSDGASLLDRHSDADHNRTVFTLAGERGGAAATRWRRGAAAAIERDRHDARTRASTRRSARSTSARSSGSTPRDRDAAPGRGARGRRPRSARSASPSSSTASWPPGPSTPSAPTSATAASPSCGCGWRRASCAPTAGPALPHRTAGATLVTARPPLAAFNVELDGGDVDAAACRRRRAARVGRRPARRAGDRPAARQRPRPGLDQRPRPARRAAGEVVERVRELAAPLGARRSRPSWSASIPEAALAGYPDDVPIRGFDPAPHTIERRLAELPELARSVRFRVMAQTKKKRRRKHRGTQGGRVDPNRRAGRPRSREEAKARARAGRKRPATRVDAPPTWRSAIVRGLVAAVIFSVLLCCSSAARSAPRSRSAASCSPSTSRPATTSTR